MRLFDMTESQLDAAVQAHYDWMYREAFERDEPEPCCGNCVHYDCGDCGRLDLLHEEDIERDEDDYCDYWEQKEEDDYPAWVDGDR